LYIWDHLGSGVTNIFMMCISVLHFAPRKTKRNIFWGRMDFRISLSSLMKTLD